MITELLSDDFPDDQSLKTKFQEMFGSNEVYHAFISLHIPRIRKLLDKREILMEKLNKSIQTRDATDKTPTLQPSRMPWKKERVNAIEFYQNKIEKLDGKIAEAQKKVEKSK